MVMANETGPQSDADRIRNDLLGQWQPTGSSYLNYRKEVETMIANQEKSLHAKNDSRPSCGSTSSCSRLA